MGGVPVETPTLGTVLGVFDDSTPAREMQVIREVHKNGNIKE